MPVDAMAARFLIALSLFLCAATPFTEHLWTFDRFLRGGQDFEFTLIALILFFCLVLLLARHAQHGLSNILALCSWLFFLYRKTKQAALAFLQRSVILFSSHLEQVPPRRTTVPLRI